MYWSIMTVTTVGNVLTLAGRDAVVARSSVFVHPCACACVCVFECVFVFVCARVQGMGT